MIIQRRITIVQIRKPVKHELNDELQWFGNSLGLFSQRDKDRSCFRIFIELLKTTKQNYPVSSDELAYKTGLSRGTIIHHINKMMEAGLVIAERNRYILRVGNLAAVVEELQKDMNRLCDDLRQMAGGIDDEMGM